MKIRKSISSLTADEKKNFVNALLELKKQGKYDNYVHWHHHVMIPTVFPYEPNDPNYRNGAHRGPAFLPWHRAFLLAIEDDLQKIDSSITIPYWDWIADGKLPDPKTAPIWQEDFVGGDGNSNRNDEVETGAFAYSKGNWKIVMDPDGPELRRSLGRFKAGSISIDTLPTEEDLRLAMAEAFYDVPNSNNSPFTIGFRNRLEGWITKRGDYRVKTDGSQLHNRVHLWVGRSMTPMTSPNDPVFILHHCFVDKIWADWQEVQKRVNPSVAPNYVPLAEGPKGHNIKDVLQPFKLTVEETLDIAKLNYQYEEAPANLAAKEFVTTISPFQDERPISPFWAD